MVKFRYLTADEIECRVGICRENGLSLLLYKDARCDARILDETVGPENWQNAFYEQKGTLFCRVGINVCRDAGTGYHEWVWKADAGSPSNMEAAKGEASDAFKRACFKWGIGRELYTAPFVWVRGDMATITKSKSGQWTCNEKFQVAKIAIYDGRITGLRVVDSAGAVVFSWKESK